MRVRPGLAGPILDPREMGASSGLVAALISEDLTLVCLYAAVYGPPPGRGRGADDERVRVNVGKALAAFVETVRSGRTAFDQFRDALARGDRIASARYPPAARRGPQVLRGPGQLQRLSLRPALHQRRVPRRGRAVPRGPRPRRRQPLRGDQAAAGRSLQPAGAYSDDTTGTSATKPRPPRPGTSTCSPPTTASSRHPHSATWP
jgi:cytochrome c peroxidase